jgi:uncharacterized protein
VSDKTDLICLKCRSPMRTYERNGITIDQCTACHGIFLDRGELERLIGAESAYLGARSDGGERRDPERGYQADRGFLGELFD